ncbi:MAG: esterase-like activity of phytase family protein, partial [Pseudomonadota bacterium]|nr:esterase-like activity of phytase family protein [Pseudomonadota bacterium]
MTTLKIRQWLILGLCGLYALQVGFAQTRSHDVYGDLMTLIDNEAIQVAHKTQQHVQTILIGRAILPAATFAQGPTSGQYLEQALINGQALPFIDKQPVQGFSAILDNADGSFLAMSDNGFGKLENSADYHLRVYTLRPEFKTANGGNGEITVEGFFELTDPNKRIPFTITNEFTLERILTGADFDLESFRKAPDGTFWFGDEFGPFLLHTDAQGVVLAPPIALPDFDHPGQEIRAPQNPLNEEGATVRIMNAVRRHAQLQGNQQVPIFSPYHSMLKYQGSDSNAHYARGNNPQPGLTPAASDVFEVAALQRAGYPIIAWTVNDKARLLTLLKLGINGIISDRPDILWAAVEAYDATLPAEQKIITAEGLIDIKRFDAQGHRGGRDLRPENTLPAMEIALDYLMTTLETDSAVTQEGTAMINHDPYIENFKCRRADGQAYTEEVLIKTLTVEAIQNTFICDLNPNRGASQQNDPQLSPVTQAFIAAQGLPHAYVMPTVQQLFDFVNFYVAYYQKGAGQSHPQAQKR